MSKIGVDGKGEGVGFQGVVEGVEIERIVDTNAAESGKSEWR